VLWGEVFQWLQVDFAWNYFFGLFRVAFIWFVRVRIIRFVRVIRLVSDAKHGIDRAESEYAGNQRDDAQPAKVPQVHQFQWQHLRLRSIPRCSHHDDTAENTEDLAKYIQVAHQNYMKQLQWLLVTCQAITFNKYNFNIFIRCRP